jgi:hypothetical protein
MQLTPLETILGTSIIALLSSGTAGIAVKMVLGEKYVTKEECQQRHENDSCRDDLLRRQQQKDMADLKKVSNIQFRMIRALVTHSDIPPAEKEKILNANGGGDG